MVVINMGDAGEHPVQIHFLHVAADVALEMRDGIDI
jgi:hypothetical protein